MKNITIDINPKISLFIAGLLAVVLLSFVAGKYIASTKSGANAVRGNNNSSQQNTAPRPSGGTGCGV